MNKIVHLSGQHDENTKNIIENACIADTIFIVDDLQVQLKPFITDLSDILKIKKNIISNLRICKEISFGNKICVINKNQDKYDLENLSRVIEKLYSDHICDIIIKNNDRSLLADIAQSLIYIDYPLSSINIQLANEVNSCSQYGTNRIEKIKQAAQSTKNKLANLNYFLSNQPDQDISKLYMSLLEGLETIIAETSRPKQQIMKVAVVASKKTGKSVIVNSMLGMELAPTSLEMATPNTCIYKKSCDDRFHLLYKGEDRVFASSTEIFKYVASEFKRAQADKENKFSIDDMEIHYPANGHTFGNCAIYDTPGPDASGTGHQDSAYNALDECDICICVIDYSKYLHDAEYEYINKIKDIFVNKNKFHSLVFVINKIDTALQTRDVQSHIKSIDFIRQRLIKIDKKFSDSFIFAVSAQDYYHLIDLKQFANKYHELFILFNQNLDWKAHLFDLQNEVSEYEDDDANNLLSNIYGETTKISRLTSDKKVNIDIYKNFTGMPKFIDYIKYVVNHKAPDESISYLLSLCERQRSVQDLIFNKCADINKQINAYHTILQNLSYDNDLKLAKLEILCSNNITENDKNKIDYMKYENQLSELSFRLQIPWNEKMISSQIAQICKMPDIFVIYNDLWKIFSKKYFDFIISRRKLISSLSSDFALPLKDVKSLIHDYIHALVAKIHKTGYACLLIYKYIFIDIYNNRKKEIGDLLNNSQTNLPVIRQESININISYFDIDLKIYQQFTGDLYKIIEKSNRSFIDIIFRNKTKNTFKMKDLAIHEIRLYIDTICKSFFYFLDQHLIKDIITEKFNLLQKELSRNFTLLSENFFNTMQSLRQTAMRSTEQNDQRQLLAEKIAKLKKEYEACKSMIDLNLTFLKNY